MPKPNEIDMTCAVCGGTWDEPFDVQDRECRADFHDEEKWKALARLEQRVKDAEMEQIRVALDQPAVEANMKLLSRIDELEGQAQRPIVPRYRYLRDGSIARVRMTDE